MKRYKLLSCDAVYPGGHILFISVRGSKWLKATQLTPEQPKPLIPQACS